MKLKIGNVTLDNQVVLAPMAGICDSAYRTIIRFMGCGLVGTEMVSCRAIVNNDQKTNKLLYMCEDERPISLQIFGSDVESFKIASEYVYNYMKPDIIDINMGCPVGKVAIKANAGCALLKEPDKVYDIVSTVVDTVPVPVTAKIRSGWDENNINAVEIAKLIEDAGGSAVTVHPRIRLGGYAEHSDWNLIKEVKENLSIPVIGNGDIWTCFDAQDMINQTNCDGIMIGRAAIGNPWLIKECIDYLEDGTLPKEVSVDEKLAMIRRHTELLIHIKTEKIAIPEMRRHTASYLKGLPYTVPTKHKLFKVSTKQELFDLMDEYKQSLEDYF